MLKKAAIIDLGRVRLKDISENISIKVYKEYYK